jgi:hypothetical protein
LRTLSTAVHKFVPGLSGILRLKTRPYSERIYASLYVTAQPGDAG